MKTFPLAIATLMISSPLAAEILPADVMAGLQRFYSAIGTELLIGNTEIDGDNTRYNNVLTQSDMGGTEVRQRIDWINMQANGDGTVSITLPEAFSATSFTDLPNGKTMTAETTYTLLDLTLLAQGDPDDIRFSYEASFIIMNQIQTTPSGNLNLEMVLSGINGRSNTGFDADDMARQTGSLTYETANIKSVEGTDKLNLQTGEGEMRYQAALPATPSQSPANWPEGLTLELDMETSDLALDFTQSEPGSEGLFTYSQQGGTMNVAINESAFSYGFTLEDTTMALRNETKGAPEFSAGFGTLMLGLSFPYQQSDSPAPFSMSTRITDFTLGDEIWAKFDPETLLGRAPASFGFSISGELKMLVDLFAGPTLGNIRNTPAEIRSISLDAFNLDFDGLGVTGSGGVTFNNEKTEPISGLPEPTGILEFSADGALGLLDKIGRLGVLDPMVIIGAKGAFGMFATPNSGPDSFSTRIEFSEGGGVMINGMTIR